jgi:hypothetical protein
VIIVSRQMRHFSAISWQEQVTFDEMMMSALHAELDFYSANSLKQHYIQVNAFFWKILMNIYFK